MASYRPRLPSTPAFAAFLRRLAALMAASRAHVAWAGAVFLLFAAALLATRPLAWESGLLEGADGGLGTWILAWGAKALAADPADFFQAPIFFPAADALAFSQTMVGHLPLFGPLLALSGDAFRATNTFLVLSVFLSGLAAFVLTFHWTRSRLSGLVAGLFFALSPIRLAQLGDLPTGGLWWMPLAFWMTSRFLERGRWRDALLAALFLTLLFASSVDLGFVLLLGLVAYAALRLLLDPARRRRELVVKGLGASLLALVALLPLMLPYARLGETWGMTRSLRDAAAHAADLLSYLTAWPGSALYGGWMHALAPLPAPEKLLFPGFVVLAGAIVTLVWAARHRAEPLARQALSLAGAATLALVLSLGPLLHVGGTATFVPLPYALFYAVLPGFKAVQAPAHFAFLLALALAVLAGMAAMLAFRRWGMSPSRRVLVAIALVALPLADTAARPFTLRAAPQASELDAFLARRAEGPIVVLPMPAYGQQADSALELPRMIAGLTHGLPMVNGAAGAVPASFLDLARKLEQGPTPQALDALAAIGVKTLVIRFDQMPSGLRERWQLAGSPAAMGLDPLWFDEGKSAVYRLNRAPKPADLLYASLLLPERLPAGWEFTMGLALNVPGNTVWTPLTPPGCQPLTVRWEGPAQQSQVTKPVWLPLTVQGPEIVGIPLRSPARPGRYQVTVEGPSLKATASVDVANWQATDSLGAPLDAGVRWLKPLPAEKMVPGTVLPLRWEVENRGENVWRARTTWRQRLAAHPEWLLEHPLRLLERGVGEVMLEVRWQKRRTGVALTDGPARVRRFPLRHDVFPGQRYVFEESLVVPDRPGGYHVELHLTDATGILSTPVERREILVHELAGLRDFLKRYGGR